ncbi:MAG: hypothetical protein SH818_10245 [Saprospiraceae bacterium]|nr:hypothetical protein [Saprospiraceae bacterium]
MKSSLQTTFKVIILLFAGILANGQVPQSFSYQGLIRTQENKPVANTIIALRMLIVKEFEDGEVVYQEEHKVRTDSFGVFSIRIGEGKNVLGAIENIDWSENVFFLRTEADINGGSMYKEIGATPFQSVPMALYAANAGGNLWKQEGDLIVPNVSHSGITLLKSTDQEKPLVSVDREQDKYGRIFTYTQDGSLLTEISQYDSSGFIGTLGASDGTYRTLMYNDTETDAGIFGILNKTWDLVTLHSNDGLSGSIYINQELENGALGPKMVLTTRTQPLKKESGIYLFNDKASYYSDEKPEPQAELKVNHTLNAGELLLKGGNQAANVFLGSSSLNANNGFVSVHDSSGTAAVKIEIISDGGQIGTYYKGKRITNTGMGTGNQGLSFTYGLSGSPTTFLGSGASNPNLGFISLYNENAKTRVLQTVVSDAGYTSLFGPKGNPTVILGSLSGKPNHGYVSVQDEAKNSKAYMYVGAQGEGNVGADYMQSNLFQSYTVHPNDNKVYIANTALQGHEAGTYIRGTAQLINGSVIVALPDYFTQTVNENKITVMLTPLSADSKGIAVINKTTGGFTAKELFEGKGNYEFDYEVKGIRKGYENEPILVNLKGGDKKPFVNHLSLPDTDVDQMMSMPNSSLQNSSIPKIKTAGANRANVNSPLERSQFLQKKKPNHINK